MTNARAWSRRPGPRWLGPGVALALATTTEAHAQDRSEIPAVQANAALQAGVAGQGEGAFWQHTRFHGGLRGDVLWGRSGPFTWGYGPMLGVSTTAFRDLNVATGLSLLIPVQEYLPLVVQAGPYVRFHDGARPGAFASLFWGSRSYNYHGAYGMAGGVAVEGRWGFASDRERTVLIVAHVDLQIVSLPFLFLINAFR